MYHLLAVMWNVDGYKKPSLLNNIPSEQKLNPTYDGLAL